jgi:hypothetical protein
MGLTPAAFSALTYRARRALRSSSLPVVYEASA